MPLKAVSVSLPTWRANVAYEEGEPSVVSRMTTGYPRCVCLAKVSRSGELTINLAGSSYTVVLLPLLLWWPVRMGSPAKGPFYFPPKGLLFAA